MTAPTQIKIVAREFRPAGLELLAPGGAAWDEITEIRVPLSPTPLDAQPSAYVRASWARHAHGTLASVNVAAATSEGALYLRLRWHAESPRAAITDNDSFADACAIMFPLRGDDAPLATMGSPDRPVQAWHWRAGTEAPFVVTASGLGTVTRMPHQPVTVAAEWARDRWSVVFRRSFDAVGVPLKLGAVVPAAFAVWQGWNAERAGLASHTPAWLALDLTT